MHTKLPGALLVSMILAALLSAAPTPARADDAELVITDADVDALIQLLIEKLLATQEQEQWVIQEIIGRGSEPELGKVYTGKLLGVREGYVEISYETSSGARRSDKIPRSMIQSYNAGSGKPKITYYRRKPRRGEDPAKVPTREITGTLIRDEPNAWTFRASDGRTANIPFDKCKGPHGPGHFSTTGTLRYGAGATALATLALLKAGVDPKNPQMKLAIDYLRGHEQMGGVEIDFERWHTYGRSLRANVWEHLITRGGAEGNPAGYRSLLEQDQRYLTNAMSDSGWYTYGCPIRHGVPDKDHDGDHSNTQFGVLGMWAVASALQETDDDYWRTVNEHWLKEQKPDGGWWYNDGKPQTRFTMTTAGLNSLFLVLDLYYSRGQGAYVRFEGIRPNPKAAGDVERVFAAIDKGLAAMGRGEQTRNAYAMYGMERLGVASGLKRLGGKDWYRDGVTHIHEARNAIANMVNDCNYYGGQFDVEKASFWLMFLAYGRAPIIFNKLATPADDAWNYYFRDLHYMCRFLTENFERLCKWQTVHLDGPDLAEDLGDAPIAYLAGEKKPELTEGQLQELKAYLEAGGTLVLHATRRSTEFAEGAKKVFGDLFADRGFEFEKVADDHPVYNVHYGRGRALAGMDLEGMNDGARTFIFLMPKDIAGAWQQNMVKSQRDLFELMANLRIYAAPEYFDLPSRLRPLAPVGTPAQRIGALRVARIEHTGHWNANPTMWTVFGKELAHETGLSVALADKPVNLQDAGGLKDVDLLQLVGHAAVKLTDGQIQVLADWLKGGGMLLIDASGGRKEFADSAEKLYLELERRTGGRAEMVSTSQPLIMGRFAGGKPTGPAVYNRWGVSQAPGDGAPMLKTIQINGRDAVLYSPVDLSATVNGHFIHGLPGYKAPYARKLLANIVLFRHAQLRGTDKP